MDRKYLAETVSHRDVAAEPPWMDLRRVSARCLRFMSVANNAFKQIHWHRDMNCVLPPKTRRKPIHGGSNPASMRDTVFGGNTQPMPLIFVKQKRIMMVQFINQTLSQISGLKYFNDAIPGARPERFLTAQPGRYCIHHHHHPFLVNFRHL